MTQPKDVLNEVVNEVVRLRDDAENRRSCAAEDKAPHRIHHWDGAVEAYSKILRLVSDIQAREIRRDLDAAADT